MNPAEQRKVINPPVRFLELIYGMISGKVFPSRQCNISKRLLYFKTPVAVGRPCWTSCHRCFGVICRVNSYKCTMRAMQYQQKRHIPLLRSVWNICRYTTAARFVNSRIFELQNFFTIVKQVELTKVCSCSTKEVVSGGDVGGSKLIDS